MAVFWTENKINLGGHCHIWFYKSTRLIELKLYMNPAGTGIILGMISFKFEKKIGKCHAIHLGYYGHM